MIPDLPPRHELARRVGALLDGVSDHQLRLAAGKLGRKGGSSNAEQVVALLLGLTSVSARISDLLTEPTEAMNEDVARALAALDASDPGHAGKVIEAVARAAGRAAFDELEADKPSDHGLSGHDPRISSLPPLEGAITPQESMDWVKRTAWRIRRRLGQGPLEATAWPFRGDGAQGLAIDFTDEHHDIFDLTLLASGEIAFEDRRAWTPDLAEAVHLTGLVANAVGAKVTFARPG